MNMYPDTARAHGLAIELQYRYGRQRPPMNVLALARTLKFQVTHTTFRANIADNIRAVFTPDNNEIHLNVQLGTKDIMITVARIIGVHLLYPHNTDDYFNAIWTNPESPRRPEDDVLDAFVSYLLVNRQALVYFAGQCNSNEELSKIFCVPTAWIPRSIYF